MTTQATPIKPADLSPYSLHSPETIRKHAADTADYFDAVHRIEQAAQAKADTKVAYANRTLDDDEYFALAVNRKKEQDALQAERAAAEKVAALAEIDRLMSSPAIADVMHRNEYSFLQEVVQWANRSYTLPEEGFLHFGNGLYHVHMKAPVAKKVSAK